jgi:hypothetical protein
VIPTRPGASPGSWWSDWDYFTNNHVLANTGGTGTVSADGMSYSAVATY